MRFSFLRLGLITFVLMGMVLGVSMYNADNSKAAFGVSPPWVRNDHLLPGTTFEQVINLSRNSANFDGQVTVRIEDTPVAKWLKIENKDNLIMKKGERILPMKVTVKVPKKAAIKNHRGGIFVDLQPIQKDGQKGGTVAIKLGAHILVDLTVVGDKIIDYKIKSIATGPLNEVGNFYLNVELQNLGNVDLEQIKGQVEIYDRAETEIIKSLTFSSFTEVIGPDEIAKIRLPFDDVQLDAGEYWVIVKVFKDSDVIYENRLFQKVTPKIASIVVTSEDVETKRPSLPKLPDDVEDEVLEPGQEIQISEEEMEILRTAASIEPRATSFLLVFGMAGFIFGFVALIAVIVFLIIILRNQHRATIQQYLAHSHFNKPTE